MIREKKKRALTLLSLFSLPPVPPHGCFSSDLRPGSHLSGFTWVEGTWWGRVLTCAYVRVPTHVRAACAVGVCFMWLYLCIWACFCVCMFTCAICIVCVIRTFRFSLYFWISLLKRGCSGQGPVLSDQSATSHCVPAWAEPRLQGPWRQSCMGPEWLHSRRAFAFNGTWLGPGFDPGPMIQTGILEFFT